MNYRFLDQARTEYYEAITYYEDKSVGLGDRFAEEIAKTLERVRQNPELWSNLTKKHRICRAHDFPYGLIYEIISGEAGGDIIEIVAVTHLHRKPGYWQDRT